MAFLNVGEDVTSFDPFFFWAPKKNPFPDLNREYADLVNGDTSGWTDRGWRHIVDTVNGASVTKRRPTAPITGDRLGRVKSVPSGDSGVVVGLQLLMPEMDLLMHISSMSKAVQSARSEVVTLLVTAGANAAGNVSVVLDGMITPVAILGTDATPEAVAAKIRATAFAGWTTGGAGATVTFTAIAQSAKGAAAFQGGPTGATATVTKTVEGFNAINSRFVSEKADNNFMLGFQGMAREGGLFEEDTIVFGLVYNGENTANAEWIWRETGADALLRPNITLEAMPTPIQDAQLEGSGLGRAALDPIKKFTYHDRPALVA